MKHLTSVFISQMTVLTCGYCLKEVDRNLTAVCLVCGQPHTCYTQSTSYKWQYSIRFSNWKNHTFGTCFYEWIHMKVAFLYRRNINPFEGFRISKGKNGTFIWSLCCPSVCQSRPFFLGTRGVIKLLSLGAVKY